MADEYLYAVSNSTLPDLLTWQEAINVWNLLVPVQLLDVRAGDRPSKAKIGDKIVDFECVRSLPHEAAHQFGIRPAATWQFAYGFRGQSVRLRSIAAIVACISYAMATGGGVVQPEGVVQTFDEARKGVDGILAAIFDLNEPYYVRYPSERPRPIPGATYSSLTLYRD